MSPADETTAAPGHPDLAQEKSSITTEPPCPASGASEGDFHLKQAACGCPQPSTGEAATQPAAGSAEDVGRRLALVKAAAALGSLFPADESLVRSLLSVAKCGVETCPPSGETALLLAYLYAATLDERWHRQSVRLLGQLPADARTAEALALLEGAAVAV